MIKLEATESHFL